VCIGTCAFDTTAAVGSQETAKSPAIQIMHVTAVKILGTASVAPRRATGAPRRRRAPEPARDSDRASRPVRPLALSAFTARTVDFDEDALAYTDDSTCLRQPCSLGARRHTGMRLGPSPCGGSSSRPLSLGATTSPCTTFMRPSSRGAERTTAGQVETGASTRPRCLSRLL